eukprot:63340_1
MSVQFSSYIKYDTVKKRYQIQRKNCKLVKDSTYGKSLTALSIGTPRKATLSQLNEYYNKYGIGSHKKYKNVNVNITYDTIEEIIAAVKVFCLAHSQVPMGVFDTDLFEIAERVEMDPNTSITHLFDMVKNAMKTGTPPTCYVSKENINIDEEEKKDDIVEDDIEILDELQVRNVEQLSNHLVSDEYEEISDSDDDDDDDYNIDNDFE